MARGRRATGGRRGRGCWAGAGGLRRGLRAFSDRTGGQEHDVPGHAANRYTARGAVLPSRRDPALRGAAVGRSGKELVKDFVDDRQENFCRVFLHEGSSQLSVIPFSFSERYLYAKARIFFHARLVTQVGSGAEDVFPCAIFGRLTGRYHGWTGSSHLSR